MSEEGMQISLRVALLPIHELEASRIDLEAGDAHQYLAFFLRKVVNIFTYIVFFL